MRGDILYMTNQKTAFPISIPAIIGYSVYVGILWSFPHPYLLIAWMLLGTVVSLYLKKKKAKYYTVKQLIADIVILLISTLFSVAVLFPFLHGIFNFPGQYSSGNARFFDYSNERVAQLGLSLFGLWIVWTSIFFVQQIVMEHDQLWKIRAMFFQLKKDK